MVPMWTGPGRGPAPWGGPLKGSPWCPLGIPRGPFSWNGPLRDSGPFTRSPGGP